MQLDLNECSLHCTHADDSLTLKVTFQGHQGRKIFKLKIVS